MWRERILFLAIGVLAGALGFSLARGAVKPDPGTTTDASEVTITRLERQIAELEAEARRPTALAVPPTANGMSERAVAPAPQSVDGAPSIDDSSVTPSADNPEGSKPAPTSNRLQPFRFDLANGAGQSVGFGFVQPAGTAGATSIVPDWSPTVIDDKLRFGSDKEKAQALIVLSTKGTKDYLPVAQRALESHPDDSATRSLIGSIARMKDRPWSAKQITGAPDTPIAGDLGTAWASASGDMGDVTVELTFERAVRVDRVRIHETYNAGAVARILAKAADGTWDVLWEGRAPTGTTPTWFGPTLASTRYATNSIRLVLDTDRVPDWNEIDAVELEGDGIRQWVSEAKASSSYADR